MLAVILSRDAVTLRIGEHLFDKAVWYMCFQSPVCKTIVLLKKITFSKKWSTYFLWNVIFVNMKY